MVVVVVFVVVVVVVVVAVAVAKGIHCLCKNMHAMAASGMNLAQLLSFLKILTFLSSNRKQQQSSCLPSMFMPTAAK